MAMQGKPYLGSSGQREGNKTRVREPFQPEVKSPWGRKAPGLIWGAKGEPIKSEGITVFSCDGSV